VRIIFDRFPAPGPNSTRLSTSAPASSSSSTHLYTLISSPLSRPTCSSHASNLSPHYVPALPCDHQLHHQVSQHTLLQPHVQQLGQPPKSLESLEQNIGSPQLRPLHPHLFLVLVLEHSQLNLTLLLSRRNALRIHSRAVANVPPIVDPSTIIDKDYSPSVPNSNRRYGRFGAPVNDMSPRQGLHKHCSIMYFSKKAFTPALPSALLRRKHLKLAKVIQLSSEQAVHSLRFIRARHRCDLFVALCSAFHW